MALPRIRDSRGISPKAFDGNGNYTLGVKDQLIFSEIDLDKIKQNAGFDITIVTSAKSDAEAKTCSMSLDFAFLNALEGLPKVVWHPWRVCSPTLVGPPIWCSAAESKLDHSASASQL